MGEANVEGVAMTPFGNEDVIDARHRERIRVLEEELGAAVALLERGTGLTQRQKAEGIERARAVLGGRPSRISPGAFC